MDRFNKFSGTVKAACFVAMVLVLTSALVLLAAEKAATEKVERGFLGLSVQRLDDGEREKLGVTHGVQVVDVEKESAAAKAGIQEGDVIQSVNGEKVRDGESLAEIVSGLEPGSTAKIGLWRGGKALEVKAVLGKREHRKRVFKLEGPLSKYFRSRAYLGVNILDPDEDLAAYFSVKAGEGVLVTGVGKDTAATKAGLKPGDVIVQMGEKAVQETKDVHEALTGLKEGDSIAVTVVRHGKRETLKAEPSFERRHGIMRVFGGGKDFEIEDLELPALDIAIPELDMVLPCPPEPPHAPEILLKINEKMDRARIRIDERLKRVDERLKHISENYWI